MFASRFGQGVSGRSTSVYRASVSQQLQVVGNKLVDINGKTVILRGFSHSSAETRPVQTASFYEAQTPAMMQAAARLGANLLRLPLSQAAYLGTVTNAGISGAPYRAAIAALVASARAVGLFVILGLHRNDPQAVAGYTPLDGWQQVMANRDSTGGTTDSRAFWTLVANAYKGDTGVLFDLYNEPHDLTWSEWLNGGKTLTTYSVNDDASTVTFTWTTEGMQGLTDRVRATGATNVCCANGIGWGNALGEHEYDTTGSASLGWLSHKPVDPTGNLIAGVHMYPDQPYTRASDGSRSFNAAAAAAVLTVAASVPVLVGEYGDKRQAPMDNFIPLLLPWMERNGLSHAAWAFNAWANTDDVILSTYAGATNPYEPAPDTGEGAVVLPYIKARRRVTIAQMNISAGKPIYASSGSAVTQITQGNWGGNDWRSSGFPASVSLDLSTVPAANRTDISLAMSDSNYQGDSSVYVAPTYNAWSDYTIQGNAGAGGGAVPSTGWVDLLAVTGNKQRSRSHRLLLAASRGGTPYNWLRVLFTAGNSQNAGGNTDASLAVLDVVDASAGAPLSVFAMGDSIASQVFRADGTGFGSAFRAAAPSYPAIFEINGAPGYKARDFASGGASEAAFSAYLTTTACQFVYLAFGTNDAAPGAAIQFGTDMRFLRDKVLAAGKTPIIPTIPWPNDTTRQTNTVPLNAQIATILSESGGAVLAGPDNWTWYQANQAVLGLDPIHPVNGYPLVASFTANYLASILVPGAGAPSWTPPTIDLAF